jgi:xanthine dehydrogenase accessory factor
MNIFDEILSALQSEECIMLATVISTSGSTPASALSKMIVKRGGTVSVGTVGGGCMEGEVILHANRLFEANKAEILTFHLNEDDAEAGLICGGSLDVLIEPLTKAYIPIFRELQTRCAEGEDCILATFISLDGFVSQKLIIGQAKKLETKIQHLQPQMQEIIEKASSRNESQRTKTTEGEWIFEPIMGNPSLIIFGGGHVSKFVSRSAAMAGFQVTIVDDREKFANPDRFPEANETRVLDFADALSHLTIKPSTYIVIVTRGHRFDEIVLEQSLKTPAKYIGMIGSKRKVLTAYEHLTERGVTAEELRRVHAPIGLDIGAVTAEEIGISIVAELIRIRRGNKQSLRHMKESLKF